MLGSDFGYLSPLFCRLSLTDKKICSGLSLSVHLKFKENA
jgi:hypothetical protein